MLHVTLVTWHHFSNPAGKLSPMEYELFKIRLPVCLFGFGTFPDSPSILNFVFPARILALLALALASYWGWVLCTPLSPTPWLLVPCLLFRVCQLGPTGIGNFWWGLSFFFHNGPFPFPFVFFFWGGDVCLYFWHLIGFHFPIPSISSVFASPFSSVFIWMTFTKSFSFQSLLFLSFIFILFLKKSPLMIFFFLLLLDCINCSLPNDPWRSLSLIFYLFFSLPIFLFFIGEVTCSEYLQKSSYSNQTCSYHSQKEGLELPEAVHTGGRAQPAAGATSIWNPRR